MFSGKIAVRHILALVTFSAVGILISYGYSFIMKEDVFQNAYPSITTLSAGCIYLFITAFVEEIAWRGFLLERVSRKNGICGILFVGVIWAIWHIPMWIIRNSLGFEQIAYLFIWTILISVVLGITYYRCRNILLIAMLHASFNICYSAPIPYNIAALAIVIAIAALLTKK